MNTANTYHYLILGAGRQGTAAAYDLIRHGHARQVTLADMDALAAEAAAARVNHLTGRQAAVGISLDVQDQSALLDALKGKDGVLSAVPYYFNLAITQAAIQTGTHFCDMGGNTAIVFEQLALDEQARQAGMTIVPDCGMGPGLINTMAALAIDLLDEAEEIYVYDAGLPQNPIPPWNYQLTFHINGLTNEMDGKAVFIRDGEIAYVDTLTEPEFIEFAPLGRLEADVTSGGTSTAPWSFLGKVKRFENKVLRYPGHYEWLRAYKTLGLFSEQPVLVGGQQVIPRQLYHTLLEPHITAPVIKDICVVRVIGVGKKDGRRATVTIDLVDTYDEATGFTGMERLTGWHCAVMLAFQVSGVVLAGAVPHERAVPAADFMQALEERGIHHEIRWEFE